MKNTKIPGPCCAQGFRTSEGFFFTEVNLRLGGGCILSVHADASFMSNILKMLEGETPTQSTGFKEDLLMLRHYDNVFLEIEDSPFSAEIKQALEMLK